jgi:glucoamylase
MRPGVAEAFRNPNRRRGAVCVLLTLVLLTIARPAPAADLEQWLQTEGTVATQKLTANLLSNGAVIASPSTADPNYYFHWVRDAALAMHVVDTLYNQAPPGAERQRYEALLLTYLDFSLSNQVTPNPRSETDRGLGEPKFNTDGSAFTGDWGRPQDDGPALRALIFTRLANQFLDGGDPGKATLVRTKLYDGTLPTNSLIKRDLEYVSHHWQDTCFDLWEEVRGHHFYTRLVQRRALLEGGKLARRLNDGGAADWYEAQAWALEPALQAHWDAGKGIINATLDRDGGLTYKNSNLDAAVVLAALHAHSPGDNFFAPTSDQVLATAAHLAASFDSLYPINGVKNDTDGGALGTAIGRYPEDRYSGQAGVAEGNAWVLCTLALAELDYRAANEWARGGQLTVTDGNKAYFVSLAPGQFGSLQPGQVLTASDTAFADLLSALRSAGDRQLRRVKYHAFPDGSLSEQMNRDTGFMQSARDLTWNYAAVLTTLAARTPASARAALAGRTTGAGQPRTLELVGAFERGGIPLAPIGPPPTTRLNRGGIPIPNAPAKPASEPRFLPSSPRGTPLPPSRLEERVTELQRAIEALSREVRALRTEREQPVPPPPGGPRGPTPDRH